MDNKSKDLTDDSGESRLTPEEWAIGHLDCLAVEFGYDGKDVDSLVAFYRELLPSVVIKADILRKWSLQELLEMKSLKDVGPITSLVMQNSEFKLYLTYSPKVVDDSNRVINEQIAVAEIHKYYKCYGRWIFLETYIPK